MRLITGEWASASRTASLSRVTAGAGVPAGTMMLPQLCAVAAPRPASAKVGTSGRKGLRRGPLVASARMLPCRTCAMEEAGWSSITWIVPPTRSLIACPEPR